MKIETLLDLKRVLNKLPDEKLEHFGIGAYDGGVGIVDLDWNEDEALANKHFKEISKYAAYKSLDKYIDKFVEAAADEDFCDIVEVK